MVIALLILIFGERWFVQGPHEDNAILSQASKIITCALKHGCRMKCATPEYQLQHRQKTITWSQGMVDELSRGLRCCRVLLSFIAFYVCFDQMQNNLISQAGQMNTHGVPNDLLPALNQVGCILMGPIIQLGLYPLLHRRRIYIGPIMRITIGFGFVAASMLYATFVQYAVYTSSPCISNPRDCSSLTSGNSGPNVWLQAPIYFLISTGEIFSLVTGLEYAYDHSPKGMKVIVQAVNLLIAGVGSVIALSLTAVAHDPHLIIFYGSLAGSMGATTVIFWLLFRKYDRIERLSSKPEPLLRPSADIETGTHQPGGDEAHFASSYTNKSSPSMPSSSSITLVAHEGVGAIEMSRLRSISDTTLVHTGPYDISMDV
jgi:POT family proton-dependent oligopeptide transporter